MNFIDPTGGWAETWGSAQWDDAVGVAVDSKHNVDVSGHFTTWSIGPGIAVNARTSHGGLDAYLAKFDPSGQLIWVRSWGVSGNEWGITCSIDPWDNIYVSGRFEDTVDFDPGPGVCFFGSFFSFKGFLSFVSFMRISLTGACAVFSFFFRGRLTP